MIEMPKIGTYEDVAAYLQLSKKTVYKMCCKNKFPFGVYLRQGRFNLDRLKECIEKNGTHLKKAAA